MSETKYFGVGRCKKKVEIPCNWMKEGRCGVDTKVCNYEVIEKVKE